jgi:hypothetical protein
MQKTGIMVKDGSGNVIGEMKVLENGAERKDRKRLQLSVSCTSWNS